ncbi:MAG: hypothetical protein Ct9H300mP28_24450 [Pseudomonadota bacterium]|nr:MAG: hypothetical protein Ct9H300mP28_24450 [Pseudomonadota bacterium]
MAPSYINLRRSRWEPRLAAQLSGPKKLISDAREAEEKLKADLDEMRGKIAGLEKEAEQIVKTARKDAEIEKERIIEEGKKEIERMKRQAIFCPRTGTQES